MNELLDPKETGNRILVSALQQDLSSSGLFIQETANLCRVTLPQTITMVIICRLHEFVHPRILLNVINFNVNLCLCSSCFLSLSDYLNKHSDGCIFLIYPMRATCPAHIILQFSTSILVEERGSTNYEAPHYAIPSVLLLFNFSEITMHFFFIPFTKVT
jgi:hypothetical protein